MSSQSLRYESRPLLRLLECYVLWAIGELQPADAANLDAMTPKLQKVYGAEGDWRQVIAFAVGLPDRMPELIRENWGKNSEIARRNGVTLAPQQFAELFADANFPIEMNRSATSGH